MKQLTARDVMTAPVVSLTPDRPLTDVPRLLLDPSISGLPVLDDQGRMVRIPCEHDIIHFVLDGQASNTTVAEAMTTDVVAFPPEPPVEAPANCFLSKRLRRAPVVEHGRSHAVAMCFASLTGVTVVKSPNSIKTHQTKKQP